MGAGWTRTLFDTNGRVVEIQHFSGSALPCPWGSNGNSTGTATTSYLSNSTMSKDEADVYRSSSVDGFGRLIEVAETGIGANKSMTEIEARFDSEWVLIEDPRTDEALEVRSGTVRWHGQDREEVYRRAVEIPPKRFAIVYTGKMPQDTAIVL